MSLLPSSPESGSQRKENQTLSESASARQTTSQSEIVQPQETRRSVVIDDGSTQVSSSDGSAKPPSMDGKSVTSATTFAMDEKESLRPDDSASLRAVEEEEANSTTGSIVAGSRGGSDSGGPAFHEQLHEISNMVPPRGTSNPPPQTQPPLSASIAFGDGSTPVLAPPRAILQPTLPVGTPAGNQVIQPDSKLLDALESGKDRVWVLKIEQDLIDFLNNPQYVSWPWTPL